MTDMLCTCRTVMYGEYYPLYKTIYIYTLCMCVHELCDICNGVDVYKTIDTQCPCEECHNYKGMRVRMRI